MELSISDAADLVVGSDLSGATMRDGFDLPTVGIPGWGRIEQAGYTVTVGWIGELSDLEYEIRIPATEGDAEHEATPSRYCRIPRGSSLTLRLVTTTEDEVLQLLRQRRPRRSVADLGERWEEALAGRSPHGSVHLIVDREPEGVRFSDEGFVTFRQLVSWTPLKRADLYEYARVWTEAAAVANVQRIVRAAAELDAALTEIPPIKAVTVKIVEGWLHVLARSLQATSAALASEHPGEAGHEDHAPDYFDGMDDKPDPPGGFDPSTPEGWDESTGKE